MTSVTKRDEAINLVIHGVSYRCLYARARAHTYVLKALRRQVPS